MTNTILGLRTGPWCQITFTGCWNDGDEIRFGVATCQNQGVATSDPVLDELARLAHSQALEAATCRASNDAGARHALQLQLDAANAELDRLRALPELKIGQRSRQLPGLLRRSRPSSGASRTSTESTPEHPRGVDAGAVIVVRNRRDTLVALLELFAAANVEHVEVVDDASCDPITLELLGSLDVAVHRLDQPLGTAGPWASGVMARLLVRQPTFLVMGDALPRSDTPDDVVERMLWELRRRHCPIDLPTLGETASGGHAPLFRVYPIGWSGDGPARSLEPPYVAEQVRGTPDDPAERFARMHDNP